jgi:hypothetical protein
MSRLSREDAAKSVIAVWRWLSERPDAPKIEGNISELLSQLGNVGNVSHENGTALDERLKLLAFLGLVRRESRHEYQRGENGERTFPRYVGTTILLERDVEKGARIIAQHFARGGFLKVKSLGNQRLNGVKQQPRVDPEKVAIRTDEQERPVEAVVGEDAPTIGDVIRAQSETGGSYKQVADKLREVRKPSDAEAFVEAARQYEHRNEFVIERLVELEQLGIQIDRAKVMSGINLQRDDELEGVVKVLPFIDELVASRNQAQAWRDEIVSLRNEMRTIRRERDEARLEAQRQKEANARIVEKRVQETVTKPTVLVGG